MHPHLTISGETVSFVHLQPLKRRVTLELRGNLTKAVDVEFYFSCHCYSRGVQEGETVSAAHLIHDGSVQKPRLRCFDVERYELSKRLPDLIDQLIAENGTVSKTPHDNFYRVDQVEMHRDGSTRTASYFIFMHARKLQEPNRPKTIVVHVESAYPEQDDIPHPNSRGSRSFGSMLGEKW